MVAGGHGMPEIMLSDDRAVVVTRVSDYQLSTSVAFPGSRNSPCVIEVTSVDGRMISPTKLVVGDTHSIWLNHQTHVIPSRGKSQQFHQAYPG